MIKFLAFLGWLIIFGAIYTKDFDAHSFYAHLFKPKSQVQEAIDNPPDMAGRQLLIPQEETETGISESVDPEPVEPEESMTRTE